MRFKLTLNLEKDAFGNLLPINYQYEQSAVIYRILSQSNQAYTTWLHQNGYTLDSGKRFKLFCYSPFLNIKPYKLWNHEQRLQLFGETVEWQISFLPEKSTLQFIEGLFKNQYIEIGDKRSCVRFRVQQIEAMQQPLYKDEMIFETLSPLCLKYRTEDGRTVYLSPDDERAKDMLLSGLVSKYESFYQKKIENDLSEVCFTLLSEPKRKSIRIKSGTSQQTYIVGYHFKFCIKAPESLLRILYECGGGSLCSQGFGCLTTI